MKTILALLLASSLLFSVEFSNTKEITNSSLQKSFKAYWGARADKKFYKTYAFEVPYLNYLHTQDWYEDYFAKSMRMKKITIKKVVCKDEICMIHFVFNPKSKPKDEHYLIDNWLQLDGKWYHSYNDNPLPGVSSF